MISQAGTPSMLLTPDEAATAIGVSRATLARITFPRGPLAVVRFGSGVKVKRKRYGTKAGPPRLVVRYRRCDIESWINENLAGANGSAHNGNGER